MRKIYQNIPVLFEPYDWKVVETKFGEETNKLNETIFTLANGYLGIRGFYEEGYYGSNPCDSDAQTMINGIYEYYPYHHIWCRPGFPERFHSIVSNVNPIDIKIYIDGEQIKLCGKVCDYSRTLDMYRGTVKRKFAYKTENGITAYISFFRFVSQTEKHLLADKITVKTDKDAEIKIVSALKSVEGTSTKQKAEIGSETTNPFELISCGKKESCDYITYKTKVSGFKIACVAKDETNLKYEDGAREEDKTESVYFGKLANGRETEFIRYAVYTTSWDDEDYEKLAFDIIKKSAAEGYCALLKKSEDYWKDYWDFSDIKIDGDTLIEQGIRFGLFMINQSAGKDGRTNISANGLTGTAYSGHTFWDTEIFMSPMFLYAHPEIVKQLLLYRYSILPKAKERAKQMDDKGALYAWNSINGEECGHVFEAATAQYHIDNDIFFSIFKYYEATNDFDFMENYGIEILMEISECMAHRGNFIERKGGKFCINCVCGPDEYNPVVDNNLYTNFLTRKQFYFTLEMIDKLNEQNPEKLKNLKEKCGISEDEIKLWKKAADNMYLAYDKENEMYMQDDNFIYKDPIDIDKIPLDKLPLLTHLHPLNLWRYQVCKQADIVLLMFLCGNEFTLEMRKKIFDFYEPKTIHDSSLSAGIHSIVACDIGYRDEAYGYLMQACRMDLDNVNRNTCYGIHAACMGSCYMMIVNGYAGFRVYDGMIHFKPYIPDKWNSYTFKIKFRNEILNVLITHKGVTYTLLSGSEIIFEHCQKTVSISGAGNSVTL